MIYPYKGYNNNSKKWIYGELEILVNQKDLTSEYYIVNKEEKIKIPKDNICKLTVLKSKEDVPVYENDIISIILNESECKVFTVRIGKCTINIENEDINIYGLFLKDCEGKDYVFSDTITNNPSLVEIIGNTIDVVEKSEEV